MGRWQSSRPGNPFDASRGDYCGVSIEIMSEAIAAGMQILDDGTSMVDTDAGSALAFCHSTHAVP